MEEIIKLMSDEGTIEAGDQAVEGSDLTIVSGTDVNGAPIVQLNIMFPPPNYNDLMVQVPRTAFLRALADDELGGGYQYEGAGILTEAMAVVQAQKRK